MTAERYTLDELPGVVANWRDAINRLKRRQEAFWWVSVEDSDRLLATLEAMAGDAESLSESLAWLFLNHPGVHRLLQMYADPNAVEHGAPVVGVKHAARVLKVIDAARRD